MTALPAHVLFDEATISARVEALAAEIAEGIPAERLEDLLAVTVLTGSFVFAADLLRALHRSGVAPEADFLQVASYFEGTQSSGAVRLLRDIDAPVAGRDVLLIDDILESGRTLTYARDQMLARGARRVWIVVALEKPHKRAVEIDADFVGFLCPDRFVVGYGMDLARNYRQLPFIGALDEG